MGEKRAYKPRKPGGGRKKLKPEYDAGKNLKVQMDAAVALYNSEMSLQAIADALNLLIEHQVTAHDVGVVTGKLCFDKGLCNVLPVFCNEHQAGHRCTDIFCDFKIVGEHSVAEQLTADPVRRAAGNIQ